MFLLNEEYQPNKAHARVSDEPMKETAFSERDEHGKQQGIIYRRPIFFFSLICTSTDLPDLMN